MIYGKFRTENQVVAAYPETSEDKWLVQRYKHFSSDVLRDLEGVKEVWFTPEIIAVLVAVGDMVPDYDSDPHDGPYYCGLLKGKKVFLSMP